LNPPAKGGKVVTGPRPEILRIEGFPRCCPLLI